MKGKRSQPWLLLSPSLSVIFFFLVVPIGFIVVYSFWIRAATGADIPAFQLGNYKKFFVDFFYPSMLLRTLRISLECVALCVVLGYIPAYFFYQTRTKFKPLLMLLLMLPFWISYIIRTLSWINILGDSGLIDAPLAQHPRQSNLMIVPTVKGRPSQTEWTVVERWRSLRARWGTGRARGTRRLR